MIKSLLPGLLIFVLLSCDGPVADQQSTVKDAYFTETSTADTSISLTDNVKPFSGGSKIDTKGLHPAELLNFARTQIGVPYLYASIDPAKGFDCSGFITYVFHHFNVEVPRSSADFTNIETEIPLKSAAPGDLILFTGTDSAATVVGHMGIIIENADSIRFIHSTSGRANGVTITALGSYYMKRFVKVIRIFKE